MAKSGNSSWQARRIGGCVESVDGTDVKEEEQWLVKRNGPHRNPDQRR